MWGSLQDTRTTAALSCEFLHQANCQPFAQFAPPESVNACHQISKKSTSLVNRESLEIQSSERQEWRVAASDHRLEHPGVAQVLADGLFHTLKDSSYSSYSTRVARLDPDLTVIQVDPIGCQELELLPIREGDDKVLVTLQLLVRMVYTVS